MTRHDPNAIVRRVLGRYLDAHRDASRSAGSTRCTLVVDATTDSLAPALADANFQVVRSATALVDPGGRRTILSHRIVVTRDTASYLSDAPVLDVGIIGLDALPAIDTAESYAENTTVRLISAAITEHALVSRRGAWVLMLVPGGEHVFVRLE